MVNDRGGAVEKINEVLEKGMEFRKAACKEGKYEMANVKRVKMGERMY